MSRQADLFDRAAACERASQSAINLQQKLVLARLRDLWTAVANESPSMSDDELAQEITRMETISAAALGLGSAKAAE